MIDRINISAKTLKKILPIHVIYRFKSSWFQSQTIEMKFNDDDVFAWDEVKSDKDWNGTLSMDGIEGLNQSK